MIDADVVQAFLVADLCLEQFRAFPHDRPRTVARGPVFIGGLRWPSVDDARMPPTLVALAGPSGVRISEVEG